MSDPLPKWLYRKTKEGFKIPLLDHHVYLDHFEIRKKTEAMRRTTSEKIGETMYISQPYDPLTYGQIKHAVEVCEEHGIQFEIRADSDHYPGRTIMIEWSKKENKA